jgi:FkbM family methyltransferase
MIERDFSSRILRTAVKSGHQEDSHKYMNTAPVYEFAKALTLRWLPRGLLNQLKKQHYLRKVKNISVSDEPDLGILKYLVKPGDCVVDIGANVGVYTFFLSRLVAEVGRVYSIEPVSTTFGFLIHNVRRLRLRNVLPKQVAITDHHCQVKMMVPKDSGGVNNFYQAAVVQEGAKGDSEAMTVVDGLPLDSVLSDDIEKIRFIKCDIEGHELHCLRGAVEVVALSRPAWLMEVSGSPEKAGSNAAAVFSFMQENGYGAWVYQQGKLKPWVSGMRSVNYLFLTAQHLARLGDQNLLAGNGK